MTGGWRPAIEPKALRERAALVCKIRSFFQRRDVIEVHTPILGSHTVSDAHVDSVQAGTGFLQTSPEYFMKRLLAAGAPSCYQIGPVFRSGEVGRWHNPEFTMLEWYRVGYDCERLRHETAELVDLVLGKSSYQTVTFQSLVYDRFAIDVFDISTEELYRLACSFGYKGMCDAEGVRDFLYSDAIRQYDTARMFVVNFPSESAALSRIVEVEGVEVADRFELVVSGIEIANGYNELLDADELAGRASQDNQKRIEMSRQTVELDHRLLAAMRSGLPSCAGVAVGLDRLIALAMEKDNIHDVMTFPHGYA